VLAFVGTSGYSYKEWKGKLYPPDLAARDMLGFYAGRFDTVEINNTFYRMPSAALVAQWGEQVPDRFSFALKAPRRITHLSRLHDTADAVGQFLAATAELGAKRGPLLFQLPPQFRLDLERLRSFLGGLPQPGPRVAMEFRNRSWFTEEVYDALREHGVALCVSHGEIEGEPPFVPTATWGYLRLRNVAYDDHALRAWADRLRSQPWSDAWVFFKHEDEATGPRLAERFREIQGGA
jgi:uncharacterized protein YecE (DUF72 family)